MTTYSSTMQTKICPFMSSCVPDIGLVHVNCLTDRCAAWVVLEKDKKVRAYADVYVHDDLGYCERLGDVYKDTKSVFAELTKAIRTAKDYDEKD